MEDVRGHLIGADGLMPKLTGEMVTYVNVDNAATTPVTRSSWKAVEALCNITEACTGEVATRPSSAPPLGTRSGTRRAPVRQPARAYPMGVSGHRPEAWSLGRCAVAGDGRVGRALVMALPWFEGPFGRGFDGAGFDLVILAVPDDEIANAAGAVQRGPLVGHCAGSLGLDVLAPHEAFGLHPLMTVTGEGTRFADASAAVAGSTPRALNAAHVLADALRMHAFEIADEDRAAYHAAASMASNFLVTLEDAAEIMLRSTGADRRILVPLVRATVENWASMGARALTGPIARGDEATVARHRAAMIDRAPELVALFDALCERTRVVAARPTES